MKIIFIFLASLAIASGVVVLKEKFKLIKEYRGGLIGKKLSIAMKDLKLWKPAVKILHYQDNVPVNDDFFFNKMVIVHTCSKIVVDMPFYYGEVPDLSDYEQIATRDYLEMIIIIERDFTELKIVVKREGEDDEYYANKEANEDYLLMIVNTEDKILFEPTYIIV